MKTTINTLLLLMALPAAMSLLAPSANAQINTSEVKGRIELNGAPAGGLMVCAVRKEKEAADKSKCYKPTQTLSDGTFTTPQLQAGRWWYFYIRDYDQVIPKSPKPARIFVDKSNSLLDARPDVISIRAVSAKTGNRAKLVMVLYQRPNSAERKYTLKGQTLDSKQEHITDAEVILYERHPAFKSPRMLAQSLTDGEGNFRLPLPEDIKDKTLSLSVTSEGYLPHTVLLKPDKLKLGEQLPGEVVFELGIINLISESEEEIAEREQRLIETTEGARRYAFQPKLMQALPVAGSRSFDTFTFLVPGVAPPPPTLGTSGPGISPGVGTSGQFAINGLRSRENNFTIDGSDNNDEDIGTRRQGFVALTPQSIETLQEFQVVTLLADARFGRNIGGQINALTKYGTDELHGSFSGFFTSSRFNARDFFDQTSKGSPSSFILRRAADNAPVLLDGAPLVLRNPLEGKEPFTHRQASVVIGGPVKIVQNTFFFGSFERQDVRASEESHFAVPTVKQRGFYNTGDTGFRFDDLAPAYPTSIPGNAIFSLYPFPNNPIGSYGENTYTSQLPADSRATFFSIKLDHSFEGNETAHQGPWWRAFFKLGAEGDQVTGRYNFTNDESILPVTGGALFSSLRPKVGTQNLAFFINRTLSRTTSDTIRFSFGRARLYFGEVRHPFLRPSSIVPNHPFLLNAPLLLNVTAPQGNGALSAPAYISGSSVRGRGALGSIGGVPITQTEHLTGPLGQVIIPGFSPLGVDVNNFPQSRIDNTYQIADTITHIRARQIITFGFDFRKSLIDNTLDKNFRPLAVFNGLINDPPRVGSLRSLTAPDGSLISQSVLTGLSLAAAGTPTGFFQTLAVNPDSSTGIRFTQLSLFAQDGFNFKSNFRVTLGFRYNVNGTPTTDGGRVEKALDPAEIKRQSEAVAEACNSDPPTFLNFQPRGRCDDLVGGITRAFPADFKLSFAANRSDLDGRIGFAWDISKMGHTVLRGGFGSYSGQFPGIVIDQSRNAFPDFLPLNFSGVPVRPNGSEPHIFFYNLANPLFSRSDPALNVIVPGSLNTLRPNISPLNLLVRQLYGLDRIQDAPRAIGLNLVLPQKKLNYPYSLQAGLTLEHQFRGNYLAAISYVWTRGVRLLRVATPDLGLNSIQESAAGVGRLRSHYGGDYLYPEIQGYLSPPQSERLTDGLGGGFTIARTLFESSASSSYNSLQIEVRKQGRVLRFGSAFTYSHTIDDASDFFDNAGAFALPQNSVRMSERASSNFDVRLRSVTHFVLDIPSLNGNKLMSGWQMAGIITAQTGQPYTVNSAIDVNRDGNLTDRLNRTDLLVRGDSSGGERNQLVLPEGVSPFALLAAPGQDGAIGRNTFRTSGLFTVDMSIGRNFNLGERQKLLLRTEVFNLFNHTHFGIPVRILEAPSFGSSVNTTVPARRLQFSLKFTF